MALAAPGVWVSLLESLGCQAALALAHVHTVRSHTRVPRHQGWDTAHFCPAGTKWTPTPQGRKLPEDQDTSTPKPWSPRLEKEPKNSGGGSELVSVWDETSQGGWPREHPVSLLCVLYVSCGMPPKDPSPPPVR